MPRITGNTKPVIRSAWHHKNKIGMAVAIPFDICESASVVTVTMKIEAL
jgi:hypothetical protein